MDKQPPVTGIQRKKVLVCGLRKSGKTSALRVLTHGIAPKDTFYIETTTQIVKENINTIIPLEVWDCPGSTTVENLGAPLSQFSSIVFFIDIQDDYHLPIRRFYDLVVAAYEAGITNLPFEVLVHKAEAHSEDYRVDNFREIQQRIEDELYDYPSQPLHTFYPINYYMTSVYDHTTHEAFSRIVQRITSQVHVAALENLMNVLTPNCSMAKCFLFDVNLRIYVATDASPVDPGSYEACSEYVQTILTFAKLYQNIPAHPRAQISMSSTLTSPTTPTPQYPSGAPFQFNKLEAVNEVDTSGPQEELFPEGEWASSFAQLTPETTLAYWQITGQDEFPFGYDRDFTLPPMCPRDQFCPDEEDMCLPVMLPGSACQLNRDDQCQPPPDRPELDDGFLTNRGAMCFKYTCQYANITLGQSCEVENTVYVGYAGGGQEFYNIISRDRCAPKLWCNAQSGVCEPKAPLGAACSAHKQCETYTCNTKNVCAQPPGTPVRIQLWQYVVTGAGIICLMIGMSIALFMSHKRSRAKKLGEIRSYFKEQTSYRNSIISMHTTAKARLSTNSASTYRDSLCQFGGAVRESYEDDKDSDRRGLLTRRSEDEHPDHQQDSDDEGVGYVHNHHGGGNFTPIRPPPRMNNSGGWNPSEWGVARRW
ncbi:unnamed protein product [Rhizoctonia solani]|uniref:GTP-binding protein n=1 Tax=Rhizoctonia solani TaxID=456999 RepID=A0A8H2ZZX9_9AGAM|nr:unnamed protein product [Rhizoctonia solani]